MSRDEFLQRLYEGSTRTQKLLLGGTAVASILCAFVMFGLMLVVPAKTQADKNAVIGIAIMSVMMLFGGIGIGAWLKFFLARLGSFLDDPSLVQRMELMQVRRRAMVFWSVMMHDARGRKAGLLVPNEKVGQQAIAHLVQRGARTGK